MTSERELQRRVLDELEWEPAVKAGQRPPVPLQRDDTESGRAVSEALEWDVRIPHDKIEVPAWSALGVRSVEDQLKVKV